jgi:hypothetical protein
MRLFTFIFITTISAQLESGLSIIDMDAIIIQKQRLILSLESHTENEKLLQSRVKHLNDLDSVLAKSLQIYYEILQHQDEFDENMDINTELIIKEFQKIILSTKSYQKTTSESLKETIKQDKEDIAVEKEEGKPVGVVENLLKDVALKGDSLEEDLVSNKFEEEQQKDTTEIETVIKVTDTDKSKNPLGPEKEGKNSEASSVLIDSKNNQYVLSKPGDSTAHVQGRLLFLLRWSR